MFVFVLKNLFFNPPFINSVCIVFLAIIRILHLTPVKNFFRHLCDTIKGFRWYCLMVFDPLDIVVFK